MNEVNWEQLSEQQLYSEELYNLILNSPNNSTRIKLEQELLNVAAKYKIKTTIKQIYEDYKKQRKIEQKQKELEEKNKKELEQKQKDLEKRNKNVIYFGDKAPIKSMIAPGYYIDENNFIRTEKNALVTSTLIQPISILKNMETGEELIKCAFLNRRRWEKFVISREVLLHNGKIIKLANRRRRCYF